MPHGPTGRPSPKLPKDSDTWCTESALARDLGEFFIDPCSNPRSHIQACINVMLENGQNGLDDYWWDGHQSIFCNPPYSFVMPWAERLCIYTGPWVALVKLDPTTKWWRVLNSTGAIWRPFLKRIKFERPDKPPLTANFPSALVWKDWTPPNEMSSWLWSMR